MINIRERIDPEIQEIQKIAETENYLELANHLMALHTSPGLLEFAIKQHNIIRAQTVSLLTIKTKEMHEKITSLRNYISVPRNTRERESKIKELHARGMTQRQMAIQLNLSLRHLQRDLQKLGIKKRQE